MFKPLEFEESKESDENLEEYADPRLEREDLALPETVELKLAAFDTAATCDDESYIKANEVRKERKHPKASDLSFCRKSMLSKILVAFSLNIMVVLGLYYSGALASEQGEFIWLSSLLHLCLRKLNWSSQYVTNLTSSASNESRDQANRRCRCTTGQSRKRVGGSVYRAAIANLAVPVVDNVPPRILVQGKVGLSSCSGFVCVQRLSAVC